MKRFRMKAYLLFTLILGVFILPGCGGDAGNGHWDEPGTGINPSAPTVMAVVPAVNATAVPINTKLITAAFSKAMDDTTLTITSFTLTCDGTPITGGGAVTYLEAGFVATLPLPAGTDLPGNALCTATITTAATALDGNALASTYEWTFTTALVGDTALPQVQSTVPATTTPGPTLASSNPEIKAIFTEDMNPASITAPGTMTVTEGPGNTSVAGALIPVTYNVGTRTATFIPLNPLTDGVTYTVTIKGTGLTPATDMAINALAGDSTQPLVANDYVWSFTTPDVPHLGPLTINLGAAQPYGVLSSIGITLGGGPASTTGLRVDGDVGISMAGGAGGACIGCDLTTVSGLIENGTLPAADAILALEAAYNDAISRTIDLCTLVDSGILTTNPSLACGGNSDGVFAPGLYWSGTSMAIPAGGTITLDAQNDPTAVFIFQAESTINSIGGNTHIILANMAQAKNVFWVTKTSSTIGGTNSDFAGTVIALQAVTVNTGTVMEGRALARGAAVTVQDEAIINVPLP